MANGALDEDLIKDPPQMSDTNLLLQWEMVIQIQEKICIKKYQDDGLCQNDVCSRKEYFQGSVLGSIENLGTYTSWLMRQLSYLEFITNMI